MDKKYIQYSQSSHADLPSILEVLGSPAESFRQKMDHAYLLTDWIFSDKRFSSLRFHRKENVRLKFLYQLLERNADVRERFLIYFRSLLLDVVSYEYFSFYALPDYDDFFSELTRRLWRTVFPSLPRTPHLGELITYVEMKLKRTSDARKRKLERDLLPLVQLVLSDSNFLADFEIHLAQILDQSKFVLQGQVVSLSLSGDLRAVLAGSPLEKSILHLQDDSTADLAEILHHLDDFRRGGRHSGITINAEFKLYKIQLFIGRLAWLEKVRQTHFAYGQADQNEARFSEVVSLRSKEKKNQMYTLLQETLQVLALKVIDTSAETGEHYIARAPRETFELLWSAVKGGVVTVATVIGKFAIGLVTSGFWMGTFQALNYAGSFCVIQFCGGSLATKQPATTAARLSQQFESYLHDRGSNQNRDRQKIRMEIYHLVKSQILAVLGNLAGVIPVAYGTGIIFELIFGKPIMLPEYASHYFHDFSVRGPTPLFAAFTGVLLWLSSLIGGWMFSVLAFHRFFASLEWNRNLRRVFGSRALFRFLAWIEPKMPGLLSNITLGFLLGLGPTVIGFFGLPLEVRHVTLSAGSLALAVEGLGWRSVETPEFLYAVLGIVSMGFMNILVSFGCSLLTAFAASNLKLSQLSEIFLRRPEKLSTLAGKTP